MTCITQKLSLQVDARRKKGGEEEEAVLCKKNQKYLMHFALLLFCDVLAKLCFLYRQYMQSLPIQKLFDDDDE